VWEMKHSGPKERSRMQLHLEHTLHGHTAAVTCLATSVSYNLVVSGSKVSCNARKVNISNVDVVVV